MIEIKFEEKKDNFIEKTVEKDGFWNKRLVDESPWEYTDHDARIDRARSRDNDKTR